MAISSATSEATSPSCALGQSDERIVDKVPRGPTIRGATAELRPHQRLLREEAAAHGWLFVEEGVLAIDAKPFKGQRQILDFLRAGDLVTLAPLFSGAAVSIRSITGARLVYPDNGTPGRMPELQPEYRDFAIAQQQAQLARASMHQLMIGHLEAEQRVASGLLMLALRFGDGGTSVHLPLPMSRDDFADYLAINRDTLSRIMMRFETQQLCQRLNRHAIRISDLGALQRMSPIAALIVAACGVGPCAIDGIGSAT